MMCELKEMTHSHFKSPLDESRINKSALLQVCPMEYRSQDMLYEEVKGKEAGGGLCNKINVGCYFQGCALA